MTPKAKAKKLKNGDVIITCTPSVKEYIKYCRDKHLERLKKRLDKLLKED